MLQLLRGLRSRYQLQVGVLDRVGALWKEVHELGHPVRDFPLHGSVVKPNTFLQVARLAAWLASSRTDLLHVHDLYSTLVAVPAAKLAGVKVVVGRLDLGHWQTPAQRYALARLTRSADAVVVNATAIRRMLEREEQIPSRLIHVIHNGLDLARFDACAERGPSEPLPATGGYPVVLHVANMSHPVKRQEDLLVALAHLNRPQVRLHAFLVGDGPRRKALEHLARALGVDREAHFLGYRTDVPALWRSATLGVLCSTSEGLSNAVIEGMAAGAPMVVTRAGGNTDLVVDGERGLVVEPRHPQELAVAFERLLGNREWGERLGEAGRRFVEQHLSLERLAAAHDRLYRTVLREREPELHAPASPVRSPSPCELSPA